MNSVDQYTTGIRKVTFFGDFEVLDGLTFEVIPCPADLDGSGVVDVPDLIALLVAWGTDPAGPPDFDGDGVVAVPDLLTLLAAWGPCK